jgi:hypothetical protein
VYATSWLLNGGTHLATKVPSEAGQAFAEVWRLALAHAEALARADLAKEQNTLFAEQTSLTQERKLWEIALIEAQANVAELATQRAQADVQLRERQVLVEQLEARCRDLLLQRDRLQAQLEQQGHELEALRAEIGLAAPSGRSMRGGRCRNPATSAAPSSANRFCASA